MNHDFEDELGPTRVRRSRRRPGTGDRPRTEDRFQDDTELDFGQESDDYQDYDVSDMDDGIDIPLRSQSRSRKSGNDTAGLRDTGRDTAASRSAATSRSTGRNTAASRGTGRDGAASTSAGRETAASRSSRDGRQRENKKKRRKIIGWIVAECFALIFIFTYAYAARTWNLIQRPDFQEKNVTNTDLDVDTVEKMKGYWTIAVFGVDSRTNNISKGTNADVNMICNINQDTGEIKLVSVFRDSYLNIDDRNSYNKINQAYANGGPEQAVKALNKNMDLNITDYVTFNWKAVADAINILGGVDVEISKAEFHYINSFITETVEVTGIYSQHLKSAGMNHLDGVQAVAYGRLRLMDTDFARTERQRKIIQLAFEKAKKADPAVLNNLMVTIFPQVATSVDVKDISNVAFNVSKYHIGETTGFPSARGDANMGKKGACVIPQTLESNVIDLHKFLFGEETYTPSNTVLTISKKIAADSGMYNEGKKIDKVPTDGGYIPKPTTAATEAETRETKENNKEPSSGSEEESTTYWFDVEEETDEDGNPIEPTSGSNRPTAPGESSSGTNPTGSTNATNPTNPTGSTGATKPSTTNPTNATTSPSGTTSPTRPSQTQPTTAPSGTSGPGSTTAAPTTPAPTTAPTTAATIPTIPPVPMESSAASGNVGPGGSSDSSGVIVGAPGS